MTYLLKAVYARTLAHYMRIHPQAAYRLIDTTLNYGRLPIPTKTGGTYRSLTIRRHQTTLIIRCERHSCTLMAWGAEVRNSARLLQHNRLCRHHHPNARHPQQATNPRHELASDRVNTTPTGRPLRATQTGFQGPTSHPKPARNPSA